MKKILSFLTVCLLFLMGVQAQTLNETSGTGSGVSISSGDFNTMYGDSTGSNITSGSQTTLVGYQAGRSVTTSELVAIGYQAGYTNTTGFDNTFVGSQAGRLNINGGDNTFIGTESGENNTTGYDNTFVGEESGTLNTTGYENTFIGEDAGFSNTTGYKQVFVGNEAGISSDVGYRNVAVGSESMSDVDDGHHNTAIGDSAAIDVGDGLYNTMVGAASGPATEWADFNTFVGAMSGWDNNRTNSTSNANRNTYVGFISGASNREGQDNVGFGAFSGYGRTPSVTAGGSGFTTFTGNTNRNRTTFIGAQSIAAQNDVITMGYFSYNEGQFSIGIGNSGNMQNAVGAVMLGHEFQTTDVSDYSVGIGFNANIALGDAIGIGRSVDVDNIGAIAIGANTVAQSDNSIAIGYQASSTDPSALSPTNNIAIGNAANVQGTNSVAIGNAATAINDNTMVLGGSTNPLSVGIATDTPNANASLELSGSNKGLQINRMTNAQRTTFEGALGATDAGMLVYDTEDETVYSWSGTAWTSATNSNTQDLTLSGNDLSLTDGGTVDLSGYLDNTDSQNLSLSGTTLNISGGTGVDLVSLQDGTGTDSQNLSLSGTTLNISGGTGVNLSSLQDGTGTDSQAIFITSNVIGISGSASTVDLTGYLDNTDSQNLTSATLSGNTLTVGIEDGASVNVDLSPILSALEAENAAQQAQIDDLLTRIATIEACACGGTLSTGGGTGTTRTGPVLYQNIPNPFNETSIIRYYLPSSIGSANIVFSDTNGKIISNVEITDRGEQDMTINKRGLSKGVYYYTLYAEGQRVDSKKMIID